MHTKYKNIDLEPAKKLLAKHHINEDSYKIQIGDIKLTMLPDVFCPAYTNTSLFLADNIKILPGEKILDMFSGSGFLGIKAAKMANKVTCMDKSPQAVKCIKNNIKLNKVEGKVIAFLGDLFAPLKDEKYDVIIANPPLLPGQPESLLETAILDPGLKTTERFINSVSKYLTKTGRIYLLFSDVSKHTDLGGLDFVRRLSRSNDLKLSIIAKKSIGYETYYVLLLEKEVKS